jgi:hypothetical protein
LTNGSTYRARVRACNDVCGPASQFSDEFVPAAP